MYSVYLIRCKDGSIYTGIATDVRRRFAEHKEGKGGRYTRSHGVKKILYAERCGSRSTALKKEARLKSLRRDKKLEFIHSKRTK
ncbi:MAG: GIY-YIG nuclease family protein [bacterium]|nr:GIY-YIG nuclease family protein [bacterium]